MDWNQYQYIRESERRERAKTAWIIFGVVISLIMGIMCSIILAIVLLFGGSIWLLIESFNALPGMSQSPPTWQVDLQPTMEPYTSWEGPVLDRFGISDAAPPGWDVATLSTPDRIYGDLGYGTDNNDCYEFQITNTAGGMIVIEMICSPFGYGFDQCPSDYVVTDEINKIVRHRDGTTDRWIYTTYSDTDGFQCAEPATIVMDAGENVYTMMTYEVEGTSWDAISSFPPVDQLVSALAE